ncbi:MAG: DUF4198 domain-containing protein [Candidatus Methylomirabilales bacterium]
MRTTLSLVGMLLLVAFAGSIAWADPLYLGHNYYALPKPGNVVLYVTSGDRYPLDEKIRPQKVEAFRVLRPDGKMADLPLGQGGIYAIEFKAEQEGTYVFGMARKPITVRKREKDTETGGQKEWTLAIFRSAKTLLTVGKPSDTALRPMGFRIEIVPRVHPATLKVGDYLDFDVLLDGKPFEEHMIVQATYDGFSQETREFAYASQKNPGGHGHVRIIKPGVWRVAVYYTNRLPRGYGKGADRSYLRASLTFIVGKEASFGD